MSIESSALRLAQWFTWVTAQLYHHPLPSSSVDTHLAVPALIQAAYTMFSAWKNAVERDFGGWGNTIAWMTHPSVDPAGYETTVFALDAAAGCFSGMQTFLDACYQLDRRAADERSLTRKVVQMCRYVVIAVSVHRHAAVWAGLISAPEEAVWAGIKMPLRDFRYLEDVEACVALVGSGFSPVICDYPLWGGNE